MNSKYGKANNKSTYKKNGSKQGGATKGKSHVIKVNKPNLPKEWFFMSSKQLNVEEIAALIDEQKDIEIEIWKDMCVLELTFGEESRIDFEGIETDLDDEYSNAFLKEHQVTSLFAVSVKDIPDDKLKDIMKVICEKTGGFFCGDTDDFEPVINV